MSVSKVIRKFNKIAEDADKYNARNRVKRFYTMAHHVHGKTVEVGIYDSVNKSYAVTDVRAYNVMDIVDEMRKTMDSA